jgi:metallo-beta-lactamase family protein
MGSKERFYADIMAMQPEVTGSCNLIVVKLPNKETIRFVVDCGLFQEPNYEEYNSSLTFKSESVDFVLVTHNHVDHTGRLPFMVKNGYENKIYSTEDTCHLLPLSLYDSLKVLKDISKRQNVKCLYNENDVNKTLNLLSPCKYNTPFTIGDNIKVTFLSNGHLLGAASILVEISYPSYENINLLFTGDYNNKNIFFDIEDFPDYILDLPLTVVQESTYGNMNSSQITKCFKNNILNCVSEKGTVVAPVFSLGRAQEILYELKCMQDDGSLDINIPIYFDGKLAIKYTALYTKGILGIKSSMQNFLPKNLFFVDSESRCNVLKDTSEKIIVTTSGMGSYGPAQTYIPEYITHSNALIQFTGYTAEGTLGSQLKNAALNEKVKLGGLIKLKKADVQYTTEFSAHAKADEMIAFLKQFNNLKLILVTHGEVNVKEIFAKRILDEVSTKNVGLLGRDYLFRVNPYGLVKTMSSKLK